LAPAGPAFIDVVVAVDDMSAVTGLVASAVTGEASAVLAVSTGAAFFPHNFSLMELNIPIAFSCADWQADRYAGRLVMKERDHVEHVDAISGPVAMPAGNGVPHARKPFGCRGTHHF
jgi:hypothetical protein